MKNYICTVEKGTEHKDVQITILNSSLLNTQLLGLAELKSIFPTAAFLVLLVVARKVLITHWCLGYCLAVLAEHPGCLSNITCSPVGQG